MFTAESLFEVQDLGAFLMFSGILKTNIIMIL